MLCSVDTCVRLWRIPDSNPVLTLNFPIPQIRTATFSKDGRNLIVAGNIPSIYVTNIYTGETKIVETNVKEVNAVAVSLDGTKFACGSSAGNVRVYDMDTLTLIGGHNAHRAPVTTIAFSPSGKAVLAGDTKGKISTASFTKPAMLKGWTSEYGPVHCIANTSESSFCAIASGNKIRVYDFNRMKIHATFDCGEVSVIRFSPVNAALMVGISGTDLMYFNVKDKVQIDAKETYADKVCGFDWQGIEGGTDMHLAIALKNGELFATRARELQHHMVLNDDPADQIVSLFFQPVEVAETPKFFPIPSATSTAAEKQEPKPMLKQKHPVVKTPKQAPGEKKVQTRPKPEPSVEPKPEVVRETPQEEKVNEIPKPELAEDPPVEVEKPKSPSPRRHKPQSPFDHQKKPASPKASPKQSPKASPKREPETHATPKRTPPPQQKPPAKSPVTMAPKLISSESELDTSVDLSRLSPANREVVKVILASITDQTERVKEEFNEHINTVHLDLLCRLRQLSDAVETLKKNVK